MEQSVMAAHPGMPRSQAVADAVVRYERVGSTNDAARELLRDGFFDAAEGGHLPLVLVVADEQGRGRGRMGRIWEARRGECLMVSLATVLPSSVVYDADLNGWLPVMAGLCAVSAVESAVGKAGAQSMHGGCALTLKWPNDIFCDGNKLGGILVESVSMDGSSTAGIPSMAEGSGDAALGQGWDGSDYGAPSVGVVFGVGVNLAVPADALPTGRSTSLQLHWGPLPCFPVLRDGIAAGLADALRDRLRALCENPAGYVATLHAEYVRRCWTVGCRVLARLNDGSSIEGEALDVLPDASLCVRDDAGVTHHVHTGDVGILPTPLSAL